MKIVSYVLAGFATLIGAVWLLQGVGVLGGSPMTGQTRWAVIGGALLVVGLYVLSGIRNRPKRAG